MLTNINEAMASRTAPDGSPLRSRGELVQRWLEMPHDDDVAWETRVDALAASCDDYAGFNLLVGDASQATPRVSYVSNRQRPPCNVRTDGRGVHGLSNSVLDSPWPKVHDGERALLAALADAPREDAAAVAERLFAVLAESGGEAKELTHMRDTIHVEPIRLRSTPDGMRLAGGVPVLVPADDPSDRASPSSWYATRTATVLLITRTTPRRAIWIERDTYTASGTAGGARPEPIDYTDTSARARHERRFEWTLR